MTPPTLRWLRADNPSAMTLDGTRTYILGHRRPLVVDPGPALEAHLAAVVEALEGETPAALLLTHGHADHAGGAEALASRTGAPVWMGRGAHRLPFEHQRVDRWLEDGDLVECGAGAVRVVHTPGHAPEHLCALWTGAGSPAGGGLFAGDLFLGEGDTTLVAAPEGDLKAYLESLDRVQALAPGIMYPAHGEPLNDPGSTIRRYRSHRRQRIEQVASALRRNPGASAAELVESIYGPRLRPELRGAAEGSIRAVLEYLQANP